MIFLKTFYYYKIVSAQLASSNSKYLNCENYLTEDHLSSNFWYTRFAVSPKLSTDLVDFKWQKLDDHLVTFISNLKKILPTLRLERVPQHKNCKMAAVKSSNLRFEKPRKKSLANICEVILREFY